MEEDYMPDTTVTLTEAERTALVNLLTWDRSLALDQRELTTDSDYDRLLAKLERNDPPMSSERIVCDECDWTDESTGDRVTDNMLRAAHYGDCHSGTREDAKRRAERQERWYES